LRTADDIEYRLKPLRRFFGTKEIVAIRTADVEDFIGDLRKPRVVNRRADRTLSPASINRSLALLRHMFNWAVAREYLERTPFRRGSETLIRLFGRTTSAGAASPRMKNSGCSTQLRPF
jgi:site-specific recombinase XerD